MEFGLDPSAGWSALPARTPVGAGRSAMVRPEPVLSHKRAAERLEEQAEREAEAMFRRRRDVPSRPLSRHGK